MESKNKRDLKWLVDRRSRVEALLLDLYLLSDHRKIKPPSDSTGDATVECMVFQLLVGTAFSLWRLVFLTDPSHTLDKTLTDQQKFLQKLIEDNTIGYFQESATRAWTGGYYVNNAWFRLLQAKRTARSKKSASRREKAFWSLSPPNRKKAHQADRHKLFDELYDAAVAGLQLVKRLIRPRRMNPR